MRARILVGFAFVLLFSFAGASMAAEPWVQPAVEECRQVSEAPSQAIADAESLKAAIFAAAWPCSTNADCPCLPPGCYCVTSLSRCICNMNICCPDGECP